MKDTDHLTFVDLFAGIGGFRLAFEQLGGRCVFACEIEGIVRQTYERNFGDEPEGDVTKIPADSIPDHDILLAGFPCQAFSIMGKMEGFADTRGTLFFEIERILRAKRPPLILLENVRQLLTNQRGRTFAVIQSHLRELGYYIHHAVLNALDFGLPQKRERVFIVGFRNRYRFEFPKGTREYDLAGVLQPDGEVPRKYEASDYIKQRRLEAVNPDDIFYPSVWHENKAGNVSIHDHACALRANASYNYQLVNGVRHFTPREMLRLQGFPDDFEVCGSYTRARFQTGNAVAVPVVKAVGRAMLEALEAGETLPDHALPNGQVLLWSESK